MVKDYSKVSPKDLLADLMEDNQEAWLFVRQGVLGTIQRRRGPSEILCKISSEANEVANQVYVDLHKEDFRILKGYRAEGPFSNWLGTVVRSVINKMYQASRREVVVDPTDPTGASARKEQPEVPQEVKDRLADTRISFARLWKTDPNKFWPLWLKAELGLPSRTIGNFLKMTVANVDVKTNLARKILR